MTAEKRHIQVPGISASPGVAIGRAYIYSKEIPPIQRRTIAPHQAEAEVERLTAKLHTAETEAVTERNWKNVERDRANKARADTIDALIAEARSWKEQPSNSQPTKDHWACVQDWLESHKESE